MSKLYKLKAPIGNTIIPKEKMTEQELRDFILTIVQDPETVEIWKEKASKDPIEDLVELLKISDYSIEVIEE